MKKLTLTNSAQNNTTVLENEFIDQYMIKGDKHPRHLFERSRRSIKRKRR